MSLVTDQHATALLVNGLHSQMPASKARSAERQGFLRLSVNSHANFPPLQFAFKPALKLFLLYKLLTLEQ